MDNQQNPVGNVMPQNPMPPNQTLPKEKSVGPVIGIIIIILIIILGGLYFWGERILEERDGQFSDPTLEALMQRSSSDEIEAIDADLQATVLNSLDAELQNINAELGSY